MILKLLNELSGSNFLLIFREVYSKACATIIFIVRTAEIHHCNYSSDNYVLILNDIISQVTFDYLKISASGVMLI